MSLKTRPCEILCLLALLSVACIRERNESKPFPQSQLVQDRVDDHELKSKYEGIVIRFHNPIEGQKGLPRHIGVDFVVTSQPDVIAIGAGEVLYVGKGLSDRMNTGETIIIRHDQNSEAQFVYVHLENISVKVGDRVRRGQKVADAWSTNDQSWVRHVHLEFLHPHMGISQRDPLRLLEGCLSAHPIKGLVFPVPC
jgi:hypothetical protein